MRSEINEIMDCVYINWWLCNSEYYCELQPGSIKSEKEQNLNQM